MAGVHLVVEIPDGTKFHFDSTAVPSRGHLFYLTDTGIGRVDRVVWVAERGGQLRHVEVQLVDWTAFT